MSRVCVYKTVFPYLPHGFGRFPAPLHWWGNLVNVLCLVHRGWHLVHILPWAQPSCTGWHLVDVLGWYIKGGGHLVDILWGGRVLCLALLLCHSGRFGLGQWMLGAGGHLVEAGGSRQAVARGEHVDAVWVGWVGGAGGEGRVHGCILGRRGKLAVGTLRQVEMALGWAWLARWLQ